MKRVWTAAALVLCLLLAACGGGEEAPPPELDLDAIAAALADSGLLREPLEAQDPELVPGQLSLYEDRIGAGPEDVADARFSMTLGTAADQFLLLEAADEGAADRLEEALSVYAEDQRSAFEFYAPEEAHLLDDPVIERRGTYLLFAVGEDRGALAELCGKLMDGEDVDLPAAAPGPAASPAEPSAPEPEISEPEAPGPEQDAPEPGSPAPLTEEDKAAAEDAAMAYYRNTVFQVDGLKELDVQTERIVFQVRCSKGGEPQDPDRTIVLERQDGVWTVVSEGY